MAEDVLDSCGSSTWQGQLTKAGLESCSRAPPFFSCVGRQILLEVHMGDIHHCGPAQEVITLMKKLSETVTFRRWTLQFASGDHRHLKRTKQLMGHATDIAANPKYLQLASNTFEFEELLASKTKVYKKAHKKMNNAKSIRK